MNALVYLVILLCAAAGVESSCGPECHCPDAPLICAPGNSLIMDGCNCCKVCARQFNQDCSTMEPCDHIKGLECSFGSSDVATRGICRAKSEGRPCEFAGSIYQNGENFQPNCKHQCTCIDGVVGCMPLCPQEFSLPTMDCPKPRLVKVTGQCCEEWACDTNHIGEDSGDSTEEADDSVSYEEIGDQPDAEPLSSNELSDLISGGLKIEPEGQEVLQNEEGQGARAIHLCRLRQCAEVQAPLVWLVHGRALLHPIADPHHPRALPLRGWRDLLQEHDVDQQVPVPLQLPVPERDLLPLLHAAQRHSQVL
uniref:CCN family member 1-like isoform X2 n=1 Tax=Pristiophorus japonicus TaxID=55135 RepID=UPI00398F54D3